jgi:ABC-2 type transport system permease protein
MYKEFLSVLADPRARAMLIFPPLVQLVLFSFAATLEVKNVDLMILNQDGGYHGYELSRLFGQCPQFRNIRFADHPQNYRSALEKREIIAAVFIPSDFSRKIAQKSQAELQVIFDGRKSNASQVVNSYLAVIVAQYAQSLADPTGAQIQVAQRHWFNPNLENKWSTIPSLVGILTLIMTLSLSALSLAREKEMGTFDQLLVSPLTPAEILTGKLIPSMIFGTLQAQIIVFVGWLALGVPFNGSYPLLLSGIILFSFSVVGFGLFISSLAQTQQQAILGAFMFMVPAIALSGFASPVENMPLWLQKAVWLNPMRHGVIIFKGIFLKNSSAIELFHSAWPLLLIGTVSLLFSGWFFRRSLS